MNYNTYIKYYTWLRRFFENCRKKMCCLKTQNQRKLAGTNFSRSHCTVQNSQITILYVL